MEFLDIYLNKYNNNDYYDIDFENGDIKKVAGLDTSIIISVLSNQRASRSEISEAYNRGGWWGNLFLDYENGSKVWLLFQAKINRDSKNSLRDYLKKCLQWLIDDGYINSFNVLISENNNTDYDFIVTTQSNNIENSKKFKILEVTGG